MGRRRQRSREDNEGLFEALVELSVRSPLAGFAAAIVLAGIGLVLPTMLPKEGQVPAQIFRILFLILAAVTTLFAVGTLIFRGVKRGTDALVKTIFSKPQPVPYLPASPAFSSHRRTVSAILSKGENAFYIPLMESVAGRFAVQVKIRLADLLTFPDDPSDKKRWLNLTANQHVDFVLCDKATMAPLLAIELDDKSHNRPDRQRRDAIVDEVLKNAGLAILHVKCQPAYDIEELRLLVANHLQTNTVSK